MWQNKSPFVRDILCLSCSPVIQTWYVKPVQKLSHKNIKCLVSFMENGQQYRNTAFCVSHVRKLKNCSSPAKFVRPNWHLCSQSLFLETNKGMMVAVNFSVCNPQISRRPADSGLKVNGKRNLPEFLDWEECRLPSVKSQNMEMKQVIVTTVLCKQQGSNIRRLDEWSHILPCSNLILFIVASLERPISHWIKSRMHSQAFQKCCQWNILFGSNTLCSTRQRVSNCWSQNCCVWCMWMRNMYDLRSVLDREPFPLSRFWRSVDDFIFPCHDFFSKDLPCITVRTKSHCFFRKTTQLTFVTESWKLDRWWTNKNTRSYPPCNSSPNKSNSRSLTSWWSGFAPSWHCTISTLEDILLRLNSGVDNSSNISVCFSCSKYLITLTDQLNHLQSPSLYCDLSQELLVFCDVCYSLKLSLHKATGALTSPWSYPCVDEYLTLTLPKFVGHCTPRQCRENDSDSGSFCWHWFQIKRIILQDVKHQRNISFPETHCVKPLLPTL